MPLSFAKKQTNVKNRIESVNHFLSHKRTSAQTTFSRKIPPFLFFPKKIILTHITVDDFCNPMKKKTHQNLPKTSPVIKEQTNRQTDTHTLLF